MMGWHKTTMEQDKRSVEGKFITQVGGFSVKCLSEVCGRSLNLNVYVLFSLLAVVKRSSPQANVGNVLWLTFRMPKSRTLVFSQT